MMKKNLQSVAAHLGDLAATMPTQRPLAVVQHGSGRESCRPHVVSLQRRVNRWFNSHFG